MIHREVAMLIRVCHGWMLISWENVWSLHGWDLNVLDYVFSDVVRISYVLMRRTARCAVESSARTGGNVVQSC
jgi:hypothetical protein